MSSCNTKTYQKTQGGRRDGSIFCEEKVLQFKLERKRQLLLLLVATAAVFVLFQDTYWADFISAVMCCFKSLLFLNELWTKWILSSFNFMRFIFIFLEIVSRMLCRFDKLLFDRQAILSGMPQKSLLARTPFTPRTKKENGNAFEIQSLCWSEVYSRGFKAFAVSSLVSRFRIAEKHDSVFQWSCSQSWSLIWAGLSFLNVKK